MKVEVKLSLKEKKKTGRKRPPKREEMREYALSTLYAYMKMSLCNLVPCAVNVCRWGKSKN